MTFMFVYIILGVPDSWGMSGMYVPVVCWKFLRVLEFCLCCNNFNHGPSELSGIPLLPRYRLPFVHSHLQPDLTYLALKRSRW